MILTVVAVVCNVAVAAQPVCRREIVSQEDGSIGLGCLMAEGQAITSWKKNSIFRGGQWELQRVFCVAGAYTMKENI